MHRQQPGFAAHVAQLFRQQFGRAPAVVVRAPGRVNLLGAHVDYNEGWVLPAAINRAAWVAAAPNDDDNVSVAAVDFGERETFSLAGVADRPATTTWLDYARGVAWVLQEAGHHLPGIDVVLTSDVPIGAGVSSSAAVEMAFVTAWEALAGLTLSGLEKAQIGRRAENEYLGVASGIMDQFASVHGAHDHLILLDCRTLAYELIPLPPGLAILVADSGIRRELANSNYNERRRQCEAAVAGLRPYLPGIRALRDVSPEEFALYAHRLEPVLRRRAQHVVEECGRVLAGAVALRAGDVVAFGRAIRRSHASSRDLYEVSIPELDVLAAIAWQTPGCYGARLTGAGFGGCVAVLAQATLADAISYAMQVAYQEEFGRDLTVFSVQAADGAAVIEGVPG